MGFLLDKRLVFVTGKGGVGKSTVAAALGLAAARLGKRTIVCEVAQQERMSRAFRRRGVGFHEAELAGGLWAISIDPQHALEEYLRVQLGNRWMYRALFESRLFQYLVAAAPGLRELVTIGKIWELAQLERRTPGARPYDLVIVDAPATGHGLALIRTPRTYREVARVGPIGRQAGKIDALITDPTQTGVVAVAGPEEIPVNETLELRKRLLVELEMELDAIVVNGVYPQRFSAADARVLAGVNGGHPALRAALSEHRRARHHRSQLRRLRGVGERLVTLPFVFERELELEHIERLSQELERRLAPAPELERSA